MQPQQDREPSGEAPEPTGDVPADDGGELVVEFSFGEGSDEHEFELDDEDSDLEFELDEEEEADLDRAAGDGPAAFEAALERPPASAEDVVDLGRDQQMAIELAFEGLENKSFYEVLLLPRTADDRAIKRAYYKLSKEYHPDKFYRKRLGPFKAKLEAIFGKINEAYRVLSDAQARDDYDVLVFGRDGKDAATPTEATLEITFVTEAEKKKEAARKAKENLGSTGKKRRRKKPPPKFMTEFQNQLALRVAKARRHVRKGEEAMEKGEHGDAARHFQAALALDPRNVRAKSMYKRMAALDRNARAEALYKQGKDALLAEDTKRAAEFFGKAVECRPTKGKYYNEFGRLIATHTLQQRVGLELLRKAVEMESRNVEYTMDLARAYEEVGMPSNAIRAYERVLQLDPKRSEASKALKKLK